MSSCINVISNSSEVFRLGILVFLFFVHSPAYILRWTICCRMHTYDNLCILSRRNKINCPRGSSNQKQTASLREAVYMNKAQQNLRKFTP